MAYGEMTERQEEPKTTADMEEARRLMPRERLFRVYDILDEAWRRRQVDQEQRDPVPAMAGREEAL